MGDTLKKVSSGDPLRIPAQTYNLFLDTARQYLANTQNAGVRSHPASASDTRVLVKNTSGSDCAQFAVLGIEGIVFNPTDALEAFKQQVVVSGSTPSSATHSGGRFVVLAEPVASGQMGSGWIAGVCQVQVNITQESHCYADVTHGSTSSLKSVQSGPCLILWKPSGTGLKWAIVRLGAGGGSAVRKAFLKTDTGPGTTVQCYLDSYDPPGEEITVHCELFGSTNLNECVPPVSHGWVMPVYYDGILSVWRSMYWFMAKAVCP
jgi:hypothetical protein